MTNIKIGIHEDKNSQMAWKIVCIDKKNTSYS